MQWEQPLSHTRNKLQFDLLLNNSTSIQDLSKFQYIKFYHIVIINSHVEIHQS